MSRVAGGLRVADLPERIPVFPLAGVLLLPGGRLPLNVFEPRYLALVDAALGMGRMFGMIQPAASARGGGAATGLCRVGCLGRISSFAETSDGRYVIALTGLVRFTVREELEGASGYRRLHVDYRPYGTDLDGAHDGLIDRTRLMKAVRAFLDGYGVALDWGQLDGAPDDLLITTLAMTCPLSAEEKQALLEAPTLAERCRMMTAMIEMALLGESGGGTPIH